MISTEYESVEWVTNKQEVWDIGVQKTKNNMFIFSTK